MSIQCDTRWQNYCMEIHHNNLASIKPTFSTRTQPQKAQPKRKAVRREKDILRENKRLLDSLKFIISHPSESDLGQDNGQTTQAELRDSNLKLIQNKRKKQQQAINAANQHLRCRVKELPAVYSSQQWEREYSEHRYLLKRLEKPLVPVSKPLPSELIGSITNGKAVSSPRFSTIKQPLLLRPHQLKRIKHKKAAVRGASSTNPEVATGSKSEDMQNTDPQSKIKKNNTSDPPGHPIESPSPENYKFNKK